VVLRFKEPDADFLGKLGDERNVMLPREVKEQHGDFKGLAIGTGPFMLKDFKPDQVTIVERNPRHYDNGADGKPLPYIDELHQVSLADAAALLAALRSGAVDQTMGSSIQKSQQDALKQASPQHTYYADPAMTLSGLWLNPNVAPWNDVRVRRALSLAIDRDDLIGIEGGGAIYQGFVISGLTDFAWPLEKVKEKFKADPEEAKRLLAEAGFVQGPTPFSFRTGTSYTQQIEVVQRHLELVGIKAEVRLGPGAASGPIIRAFDGDMSWGQPGGGRFASYWAGDLVRTGAGRNVTRFGDAKLDAMIDAQLRELDLGKRKQLIDQIQDYMYEQMPYVPTVARVYHGFISCQVKNMRPPNAASNYNWGFEHAWVDPTGC
jgi:peptide/nickel transport system substrate-binding protein